MLKKVGRYALGLLSISMVLFAFNGMTKALFSASDAGPLVYSAVPFPVLGALLAFGLWALGAVKPAAHPLEILPALTALCVWLALSDTPVRSVPYSPSYNQMVPVGLLLLALLGAQLVVSLTKETPRFSWKRMLVLLGISALLPLVCIADAALGELRQSTFSMLSAQDGAKGRRIFYIVCNQVLFLASGAAVLPLIRRGRKLSGILLLVLGAADALLLVVFTFYTPAIEPGTHRVLSFLWSTHSDLRNLSVDGALLCAGIKLLLSPHTLSA